MVPGKIFLSYNKVIHLRKYLKEHFDKIATSTSNVVNLTEMQIHKCLLMTSFGLRTKTSNTSQQSLSYFENIKLKSF